MGAGQTPLIPEELAPTILDWIRQGPRACGLKRANRTHVALADILHLKTGIRVRETAMGDFCRRHGVRLYRPTYRFLRADPARQQQSRQELSEKRQAERGDLVLPSQDEARFPVVPTLMATLGLKGERPVIGTRDCKDVVHTFASANVTTGEVTSRLYGSRTQTRLSPF